MMETTVLWFCVSTGAAESGPDPAGCVITMANAVPRLAPGGGVTGVISVCPARTASTWLALTLEFEPVELEPVDPISVRRTRAAAAGADSTNERAKPDPVGFPATTALSPIRRGDGVEKV